MSHYVEFGPPAPNCSFNHCSNTGDLAHEGISGKNHPICRECVEEDSFLIQSRKICGFCNEPLSGMIFKSLTEKRIYDIKKTSYDAVIGACLGAVGIPLSLGVLLRLLPSPTRIKQLNSPILFSRLPGRQKYHRSNLSTDKTWRVHRYAKDAFQRLVSLIGCSSGRIALNSSVYGFLSLSVAWTLMYPLGKTFGLNNTISILTLPILIGALLNVNYERRNPLAKGVVDFTNPLIDAWS